MLEAQRFFIHGLRALGSGVTANGTPEAESEWGKAANGAANKGSTHHLLLLLTTTFVSVLHHRRHSESIAQEAHHITTAAVL